MRKVESNWARVARLLLLVSLLTACNDAHERSTEHEKNVITDPPVVEPSEPVPPPAPAGSELEGDDRNPKSNADKEMELILKALEAGADPAEFLEAPAAGVEDYSAHYKVELGADKVIKIPGPPGELRIWIGMPDLSANFSEEMAIAVGMLPAVGRTAQVTPFAPAFKVEPKSSICMVIHPSGSEFRFQLTPLKKGTFKVGADVLLFDSEDCTGPPIPKIVESLHVKVEVDSAEILQEHSLELWKVVWVKFLEFWGAVVALFFAVLLFLLRGWLKKRLDFDQ